MTSNMTDGRCYKANAEDQAPGLFQSGGMVFQIYHVGWIICGFFTIIATVVSFWLVNKHLRWYTNKREQRYIVRLLFMVPLYATISFASYLFWNHATPLLLLRDGYEAIVLTSFFYLLLMYLSHDPDQQKAILRVAGLSYEADREAIRRGKEMQKWVFPLGFIKWKPENGFYFLQYMKWGVLQYCVIRPSTTLAAIILDYVGLYCEDSWGLGWGHIYITIIVSISVSVAMYCLIQLYVTVSEQLAPHAPLLKLFAVKAVVFLTFWQATFLGVLSMLGVVKDSVYMTADDINIGIGALLETFEMVLFAFLHIKAFSYKPYRPFHPPNSDEPPLAGTPRLRSLRHAFDFRETFREVWSGSKYMYDQVRGREPAEDLDAKRAAYYQDAFGRPRSSLMPPNLPSRTTNRRPLGRDKPMPSLPVMEVEPEKQMEMRGQRQWLEVGDNREYRLGLAQREQSDSLETQIARELERRGYRNSPGPANRLEGDVGHGRQRSWWRDMYDRISSSGPAPEQAGGRPDSRNRGQYRSRSRRPNAEPGSRQGLLSREVNLDDPPPRTRGLGMRSQPPVERADEYGRLEPNLDDITGPPSLFRQHRGPNTGPDSQAQIVSGLPPFSGPFPLSSPPRSPPLRAVQNTAPLMLRNDSVLARIFPPNTDIESSAHGYTTDGVRSLPSVSRDGVTPSQATPRARLTGPKPLAVGVDINRIGGPSSVPVVQDPPILPINGQAATVVCASPTALSPRSEKGPGVLPLNPRRSHRRERAALDPTTSPSPPPRMQSPPLSPSQNFLARDWDNPAPMLPFAQMPPQPRSPPVAESARHRPHRPPAGYPPSASRPRHLSIPQPLAPNALQTPPSAHPRDQGRRDRRLSTPAMPGSYAGRPGPNVHQQWAQQPPHPAAVRDSRMQSRSRPPEVRQEQEPRPRTSNPQPYFMSPPRSDYPPLPSSPPVIPRPYSPPMPQPDYPRIDALRLTSPQSPSSPPFPVMIYRGPTAGPLNNDSVQPHDHRLR
ncbi:DUF300-domain-containing protein [Pluteus cervinus]|uniref:DUF300-domain-containing protein n=1 Tax=Pluteus cervinus TaxID=181527 RepID=A0ACD3BBP2_9AGAR|nr:DUF300-domain-containing protein [Pluteus cervinus]